MADTPFPPDPWQTLRRFTAARLALGRAGHALPTREILHFQLSHAQARDAVHKPVDFRRIEADLTALGYTVEPVHSEAPDRTVYLQRPDLGRRLAPASRQRLLELPPTLPRREVVFIIGDGLSAWAVEQHSVPLLAAVTPLLQTAAILPCPRVFLAQQARVALSDEIGEALQASVAVILIGERPGLSSPDSLGVYLTYGPRRGRQNTDRNCISNIRPAGLSYAAAAQTLAYLLQQALRRQVSGVALKDERAAAQLETSSRSDHETPPSSTP